MPSRSPTISPAPTPGVQNTACTVDAEIICQSLDQSDRVVLRCEDITNPNTIVCDGDLEATGLGYKYLGGADRPDLVWVEMSGGRSGTVLETAVAVNQYFYAEGDFRGEAQIDIFTVANNNGVPGRGADIEGFTINTECAAGDTSLTLTTINGPLQLFSFRNALGFRTSVFNVRLQYFVANAAALTMIAEDAFINPGFGGAPFDVFTSDLFFDKNTRLRVFNETYLLTLGTSLLEVSHTRLP
jgi:hypothetical protein